MAVEGNASLGQAFDWNRLPEVGHGQLPASLSSVLDLLSLFVAGLLRLDLLALSAKVEAGGQVL